MTASLTTFERSTVDVLDYRIDLAALTNGQAGATEDWLQSGETIDTYSVSVNDPSLVVDSHSAVNGNTAIVLWVSGGDIDDAVYYIDVTVTTSSSRTRKFSLRLIPVVRR